MSPERAYICFSVFGLIPIRPKLPEATTISLDELLIKTLSFLPIPITPQPQSGKTKSKFLIFPSPFEKPDCTPPRSLVKR
jgi:hypothetical protein